MKRIYALIVGVALVSTTAIWGQGTVYLNNYGGLNPDQSNQPSVGIYEPDGKTAALASTFVEVLGGPVGGPLTPISTTNPGGASIFQSSDLNGNGPGSGSYFDGGFGYVPGTTASGMGAL